MSQEQYPEYDYREPTYGHSYPDIDLEAVKTKYFGDLPPAQRDMPDLPYGNMPEQYAEYTPVKKKVIVPEGVYLAVGGFSTVVLTPYLLIIPAIMGLKAHSQGESISLAVNRYFRIAGKITFIFIGITVLMITLMITLFLITATGSSI